MFRAGRELDDDLFKAEIAVDLEQQFNKCLGLGQHLVLGAENMRIVLGKATHPHQAVQSAGRFIAVTRTKLGHAQRQVTIAVQALVEDLNVAGAVHWLDRVGAVFRLGQEHAIAKLVGMTGFFPQRQVKHLGRVDLGVAACAQLAPHVVLDQGVDSPTTVVPKHHARRFFLEVKQRKLLAQAAMITLLGFLQALEVFLEVFV